mmetsp:Transcript_148803/g.477954  ORF Transcript_148803/g.477954 Transcript_148803/m.477954 type:complete len:1081 (+) Transcript_148803:146-3388(+)
MESSERKPMLGARTEFSSSLIPQQKPPDDQNELAVVPEPETNGTTTHGILGANGKTRLATPPREAPHIDFIRRPERSRTEPSATFEFAGEAVPNGGDRGSRLPDGSPRLSASPTSRRLDCSPSYAPRYEVGAVRTHSKNLAPPPGGPPRASPSGSPSASPPPSFRGMRTGPEMSGSPPHQSPPTWAGELNFGQSPPPSGSLPDLPGFSMYSGPSGSPATMSQSKSMSALPTGGAVGSSAPASPPTPSRSPPRLPSGAVGSSPVSNRNDARTPGAGATPGASPTRRSRINNALGGNQRSSSRIDPEQVPRPVGQIEPVKEEGGKRYETNKYHVPPAATAVATILDRGSTSCEFMRCTVNQVPAYPSTANTAHIPVAVICQPFAELTAFEEPVPAIDFGESGPLRCPRCKAYVNPHFTWVSQGKEANCNFCGHRFEVPGEYFCAIDDKGRRRDQKDRPELLGGTVDYIAPSDYSDTLPGVPTIAFVIEATRQSVSSGVLPQVLWTLRGLLNFMEQPASRIAIITFDHALHFYSFYPGLESSRWVTMCDIDDPFVPCSPSALCIDALDEGFRAQVEGLFGDLTDLFEETTSEQACGGAALKAATELVGAGGGGHVIMFHASLPNTGIGALKARDDLRLAREGDGQALFTPQQAPFFEAIAADCLQRGVAVSAFACPPVGVYIDIASLSVVPRRTGGDLFYYPGYDPTADGERLHYDVSRTVAQNAVYSCVFKLRCSKGLTVETMLATWEPEVIDPSTFHISRMSVDSTVDFVLSHSERIEWQKHVYLQVACLHTDRRGRRLIRVHTLQLPVTSSLSNVFRYTEIDAVTNVLIKQAAVAALAGNGNFKEKMTKSCVDMLHAYRVNCASMTSAGQLILPESLKLLPLYVGAIRKMPAFRSGSEVRADERLSALIRVLGLPMSLTAPLVYPRVYTMLPLPERAGNRTDVGDNVHMPPTIACYSDKMAMDRLYLIDSGYFMRLYIKEDVCSDTLLEVFGVARPEDVAEALNKPEEDLSEAALRILAIVWQIRRERTRLPWQSLSVVTVGTPEESKLLATICEDRVAGEMNYVDFLCHVHKMVQNKAD